MKSKITMACKEIWRAEVIIEHNENEDQEIIKDKAWALFDANCEKDLEQHNFTKIEVIGKE